VSTENSVILRFPNSAARTVFLDRMQSGVLPSNVRCKPSFSEPTVVIVRNPAGTNEAHLRSELLPLLGTDVEIYDDVQFSVMAQPGAYRD
jgi:hypothetical protein